MSRNAHTGRRAVASLAVALSVTLLATGCTDSAEEPSGPIVAQGRVVHGDGDAVAGAEVTLLVWPDQEELEELEVGDAVDVRPVADATTADDGSFELRIAESALAELPSDPSAIVDFELQAIAPEGDMSYSWSTRPAGSAAPGVFVRADGEPPADPATADPTTVVLNVTERTYDDGTDASTLEDESN